MRVDLNKSPKFYLSAGSRKITVLLILILGIGSILRFYDLGTENFWIDEMATVVEGQQTLLQLLTVGRLDQPPAYYLPFHLWIQIFGTTEVGTRSFSALVGISSIILLYLVGRELFGEQVALLSAFLMAISEFQITYSQAARFYIFFEFTTLLSVLFFILSLKSKKIIFFGFYVVASVLMVCSHAFGLFILAVQNLFFFIYVRKYRDMIIIWLICQVLILLAIIPYFYPLIFGKVGVGGEISENIGNLSVPTIVEPLRSMYHFIFSARRERSSGMILANYVIAGAVFLVGFGLHAIRQGKSNLRASVRGLAVSLQETPDLVSSLLLVSFWFLCPIMLPFILSLAIVPIYKDYYTISAAPALYLLLALGMFSIRKVVPLLVSLGVLIIMIVPNLNQYYVTDINEQWKEAAQYIEENSGPDEVIVFAPDMAGIQQKIFYTYYKGTLQGCGLRYRVVDTAVIAEDTLRCISDHQRFWVVVYDTSQFDTFALYQSFFTGSYIDASVINEQKFNALYIYFMEMKE